MKDLLDIILNKNKAPHKITGKIIGNPEHLKYVVQTRTGKVLVDSTKVYNMADMVVVYDGVIHSKVGALPTVTQSTV